MVRKEFDYAVKEFAEGKPVDEILGASYRKNGSIAHNADRPQLQDLDSLPHVTDIYHRDLDVRRYNVPFLLYPYVSLYTTRGCPAQCTFCLWPQTTSGHAWRKRSTDDVAREMATGQRVLAVCARIFLRRRHLQYSKGADGRVVRQTEAAEANLVLHLAGHDRL